MTSSRTPKLKSFAAVFALLVTVGGLAVPRAQAYELPPLEQSGTREHHPGKMVWADLVTTDLVGAEHFYSELFGWTFQSVRGSDADYAIASVGSRPIAGILHRNLPPGDQRQSSWLTFIAVANVDKTLQLAMRNGAKTISAPRSYAGRGRQAVLTDPEGAVFAIIASQSGDPPDYLAEPGEWIWSSLHSKDPDETAAFYQKLLPYDVFDVSEEKHDENHSEHLILSTSGYARASVNALPGEGHRRPHWLNFIRVNDASATAAKAATLGGRVLVEPRVDRHGGKIAVLADPYGAPIGVMEWSQAHAEESAK